MGIIKNAINFHKDEITLMYDVTALRNEEELFHTSQLRQVYAFVQQQRILPLL